MELINTRSPVYQSSFTAANMTNFSGKLLSYHQIELTDVGMRISTHHWWN
jgi:hypothetical protein